MEWGLVGDGNPHFFHKEARIHVLRYARAEAVRECQLVVGDIRLVADIFGEEVDEGAQQ